MIHSSKDARSTLTGFMTICIVIAISSQDIRYMKVEITVPEEYMGDVIGDVNSRRGRIEGMEARNGAQVINAFVPLAEMFGYATDLRSKTQGRGNYSMEVDHYEDVPRNIAEAIIAKNKGTN